MGTFDDPWAVGVVALVGALVVDQLRLDRDGDWSRCCYWGDPAGLGQQGDTAFFSQQPTIPTLKNSRN